MGFYGGLDGPMLSGEAESVLRAYDWPGNVRELENVIKRVTALNPGGGVVSAETLLPFLATGADALQSGAAGRDERGEILTAYQRASGNKTRVAEILGVSRKTLYARLKRLNLELP